MTRQLSQVFLALVLSLLGTNAWADGMVQHSAPESCCGTASFAGTYLGAAIGYGRQRAEITNETVGVDSSGITFHDDEGSVTFGGYAGYNWQRCCSRLVLGIETDFNFLNTSPTGVDVEIGSTGLNETTSMESKMDWFGTLRARAGFLAHEDLLLYATGGLAYAKVDHTLSDNCVGCGGTPFVANLGTFAQSNKDTKAGWTVGGGAEFLHESRWLLRAEALYVDLGSETHTYEVTTSAGTGTAVAKWDDQFWVARLGVAYKFGDPDCCAAPLK